MKNTTIVEQLTIFLDEAKQFLSALKVTHFMPGCSINTKITAATLERLIEQWERLIAVHGA
jgi:hypothetical protein